MITFKKIATGQGDDYTTGCLLDCNYFKEYYKMVAIDLSKEKALDPDLRVTQQTHPTGNLYQPRNTTTFFIIEESKKAILDF